MWKKLNLFIFQHILLRLTILPFLSLCPSYCHRVPPPPPPSLQQARGQTFRHWVAAAGHFHYCHLWYMTGNEIRWRWLILVSSRVSGLITWTICVSAFQTWDPASRLPPSALLFPLKPVITASPTCQPEDGWIVQEFDVPSIIHDRQLDAWKKHVDSLWGGSRQATRLVRNQTDRSLLVFRARARTTWPFCVKALRGNSLVASKPDHLALPADSIKLDPLNFPSYIKRFTGDFIEALCASTGLQVDVWPLKQGK